MARGAGALVLAGPITKHCISTTVRMVGDLGFSAYVMEDKTVTFNRLSLDERHRVHTADVLKPIRWTVGQVPRCKAETFHT